jgi:NADPH:quinone reductase
MTKGIVCTELCGESGLELQEWEPPELSPGAVRIGVRAASVNFPDVLVIRGLYQAKMEPPFVPGTECAGVVTDVGTHVGQAIQLGDRVLTVLGSGAFATEVSATPPWQQLHKIPDEMSWDEAASFNITYGTGIHGLLTRGRLEADESVLITGAAGGCGSAAVQIAKAQGAKVIAVAGGDEKCEFVRAMGADTVIDHRQTSDLPAAVRACTDGRGVDVVFDPVGGTDVRDNLRSLAWNGRYLVVGFASGDIPTIKANQTIVKGISIVGVAYGMSAVHDPTANRADFDQLFAWYRQGLLIPAIGRRFSLTDAPEAMRTVSERRAMGKIVIEMPA